MNLDAKLRYDYNKLWLDCVVAPDSVAYVDLWVRKIAANQARYEVVAKLVGCPWFLVGLIHMMECGLRFDEHLHNGDPLSAKTVHAPSGRPAGNPPWTWEQSALDALVNCRGLNRWHDWSLSGLLFVLEGFNGYGYRLFYPWCHSPYLWGKTNQYVRGKYGSDGHFDPELVSKQIGCAAFLKRASDLGIWEP